MTNLLISFVVMCAVFGIALWAVRTMKLPSIMQKAVIVFGVVLMLVWFVRYVLPAFGVQL